MITTSAVQQKGGVGKTSAICHLAFDYAENRNKRVLVIELDPQGNASHTLANFRHASLLASDLFRPGATVGHVFGPGLTFLAADPLLVEIEKADLGEMSQNFSDNLTALADHFDICLIDTAPALGLRMSVALYVSGFVFTPIELSAYSIQGVKKMQTTIDNMRDYNPDLVFLGLLPSRVDNRVPRQRTNLANLRENHSEKLIPTAISQRDCIADALDNRLPVWRIKTQSARLATAEFKALADFVYEKMGIE